MTIRSDVAVAHGDKPAVSGTRGLSGRDVLIAFLSFFGLVFAVNGYFLYAALSTYTGVVAREPYRKGLAYNERIAADEAQARLGWQAAIDAGRDGRISARFISIDGSPVRGLKVTGKIGRPVSGGEDQVVPQAESTGGEYSARTAAPLADGGWILEVEAADGTSGATLHRMKRRIWLKP